MRRAALVLVPLVVMSCVPSRAPTTSPTPSAPAAALSETAAEAAPPDSPAKAPPAEPDAESDAMETGEDDPEDGAGAPRPTVADPRLALSAAELERRFRADPRALGPISVGRPGAGLLVNGDQLAPRREWVLLAPGRAWATRETLDATIHCIEAVDRRFEKTPPLPIGDFSAKPGGRLPPHRSHQAGRDVDVGYYHLGGAQSFVRATADNLDLPRTWALVKTALRETPVEMILIDTSVQRLLADFALKSGEDPRLVDDAFQSQGKNARAPIRHVKGHANHIHFRFHNPVAEELGARLARLLPKPSTAPPPAAAPAKGGDKSDGGGVAYEHLRARSGDTLVVWAKRYGTTVEDIQRANGLTSIALKIGTVYKIPIKGKAPAKHGSAGGS